MTRASATRRDTRHTTRQDGGQASVELALVLPLVVALGLFIAQVVLVGRDHLLVTHAARGAAREAAVDRRAGSVRAAALAAAPALKTARLATETSYRSGFPSVVRVTVRYRSETSMPLVGALLPDVEVVGEAAFRDESDMQPR